MSPLTTGFEGFDTATGGLQAGKDYLIYGAVGTGKSSFTLSFIHAGLRRGEGGAMVTRRSPETVMDQAAALGWNLEEYLQSGQLVILEYPADLQEQGFMFQDAASVYEEFRALLEESQVRRLVFDPVLPLLAAPGPAFSALRARSLMEAFSALRATCLYLLDTPEGEGYVAACKDQSYGVLHFDADAGTGLRRIEMERLAGVESGSRILFEVMTGAGLLERGHESGGSVPRALRGGLPSADESRRRAFVDWDGFKHAPAAKVPDHAGQWTVVVVDPNLERRRAIQGALDGSALVLEAGGAAECLSLLQSRQTDLLILAQEATGVGAMDLTRKLRRSGIDVPVIIVGGQLRRAGDRVHVLQSGADLALERPLDLRLLKLHVRNLLMRSGHTSQRSLAAFGVAREPARETAICTTDAEQFRRRLQAESEYAMEANQPFTVVSLSVSKRPDLAEDLSSVCSFVTRQNDLTYAGDMGAAVLLSEAADADPMLQRFAAHWKSGPMPAIECRTFDGAPEFVEQIMDQLSRTLGSRAPNNSQHAYVAAANGAFNGTEVIVTNGHHRTERSAGAAGF